MTAALIILLLLTVLSMAGMIVCAVLFFISLSDGEWGVALATSWSAIACAGLMVASFIGATACSEIVEHGCVKPEPVEASTDHD